MSFRNTDYDFIQNAIGYTFSKPGLLREALDTTGLRTAESNQRLAMVGDAVLKMILLEDWYASGKVKGTIHSYRTMSLVTDCVQDTATT
jgi:dsRNA-specific ribonuclease